MSFKSIFTAEEVVELIKIERQACAKIAEKIAWDAVKKKERTGLPTASYLSLDGQASAALEINKLILEREVPTNPTTPNPN